MISHFLRRSNKWPYTYHICLSSQTFSDWVVACSATVLGPGVTDKAQDSAIILVVIVWETLAGLNPAMSLQIYFKRNWVNIILMSLEMKLNKSVFSYSVPNAAGLIGRTKTRSQSKNFLKFMKVHWANLINRCHLLRLHPLLWWA